MFTESQYAFALKKAECSGIWARWRKAVASSSWPTVCPAADSLGQWSPNSDCPETMPPLTLQEKGTGKRKLLLLVTLQSLRCVQPQNLSISTILLEPHNNVPWRANFMDLETEFQRYGSLSQRQGSLLLVGFCIHSSDFLLPVFLHKTCWESEGWALI